VAPIFQLEALDDAGLEHWATSRGDLYFSDIDCRGFIVAARDEAGARCLACEEDRAGSKGNLCERWLDPSLTSCVRIADEPSRVIMADWPGG
jgi:hypothetical protein